jgi:predicted transcriptional regulator
LRRYLGVFRRNNFEIGADPLSDETNSTELTAEIVAAFVSNNTVSVDALTGLIKSVYGALNKLSEPDAVHVTEKIKPTNAEIRKSITHDGIRSFIDGKSYKILKRHLTTHGLTIAEYKAQYGLPNEYLNNGAGILRRALRMVKSLGLGRKAGERPPAKATAPKAAGARGRPRKDATPAE